jgi:hypothetical protein
MPPGDDAPRDHTLRSESGGESLQVPGLTSAFTCGFRPYAAHRLLPRPVAGWRKRRISGVHSKSPLEFLEPFDQHQKTSACRRPTLVPRLLRNTVRFDQRSFAHTRRMSEFTNSEKINSVNGYPPISSFDMRSQSPRVSTGRKAEQLGAAEQQRHATTQDALAFACHGVQIGTRTG